MSICHHISTTLTRPLSCPVQLMTESDQGGQPDKGAAHPDPYSLAARYRAERPSVRAYAQLQAVLLRLSGVDLSAFRFLYEGAWHIATVGERQPDLSVQESLFQVLRYGERVILS